MQKYTEQKYKTGLAWILCLMAYQLLWVNAKPFL